MSRSTINRVSAIALILAMAVLLWVFAVLWPAPALITPIVHAQQRGEPISCVVTTSTATTVQAVGGKCANPGNGNSIYITDIEFDASASGIAADAFPTLKYGSGTTCGTGTTVFWGALTAAAVLAGARNYTTPFRVPPGNDICWITTTAGSKFIVLNGFLAP